MRIVIDLKRCTAPQVVLNFLLQAHGARVLLRHHQSRHRRPTAPCFEPERASSTNSSLTGERGPAADRVRSREGGGTEAHPQRSPRCARQHRRRCRNHPGIRDDRGGTDGPGGEVWPGRGAGGRHPEDAARRLAALEHKKIQDERDALAQEVERLSAILATEASILAESGRNSSISAPASVTSGGPRSGTRPRPSIGGVTSLRTSRCWSHSPPQTT